MKFCRNYRMRWATHLLSLAHVHVDHYIPLMKVRIIAMVRASIGGGGGIHLHVYVHVHVYTVVTCIPTFNFCTCLLNDMACSVHSC